MSSVFLPLRSLRCIAFLSVVASPAVGQPSATAKAPTHDYWIYVGAESADLIHRVRFGPAGTVVEKTIPVGESAVEMEGPHGLQISRDGKYLHMTTGHGSPDGKYWKFELGPDTLVGPGTFLGYFPEGARKVPGPTSVSGHLPRLLPGVDRRHPGWSVRVRGDVDRRREVAEE